MWGMNKQRCFWSFYQANKFSNMCCSRSEASEIPRHWSVIEWTHNEHSCWETNMFLPKKRIALIHIVNLCIWPGQIALSNAICSACSNKYLRIAANSRFQRTLDRWRAFVWWATWCEAHIPDKHMNGWSWHNNTYVQNAFFISCENDWNACICFIPACLLCAFFSS